MVFIVVKSPIECSNLSIRESSQPYNWWFPCDLHISVESVLQYRLNECRFDCGYSDKALLVNKVYRRCSMKCSGIPSNEVGSVLVRCSRCLYCFRFFHLLQYIFQTGIDLKGPNNGKYEIELNNLQADLNQCIITDFWN